MQQVYTLAKSTLDEVPVAAVLVSEDNKMLASATNQVIKKCDPTAHAEIVALRLAAQKMGNYRLLNSTLYVSLEPCAMCAAALVHARVKRLVFGTRDFQLGAAGSCCNLLKGAPYNHSVIIDEGIMSAEFSSLLKDFFDKKRRQGEQ